MVGVELQLGSIYTALRKMQLWYDMLCEQVMGEDLLWGYETESALSRTYQ